MTLGRIACALAVLAALCVLTTFFFPAMQGPYSAVHGPVTALLAARAAGGLRTAISHAGLNALPVWFISALFFTFWAAGIVTDFRAIGGVTEYGSILRC